MKLKIDEKGNVEVRDGKPVYIDDDNKEIEIDADQLFIKIKSLNSESKQRRLEIADLKKSMTIFEDIDNIEEWREEANKALTLSKNIDESQLIQAGKVDELKISMKAAFESEKESILNSLQKDKTKYQEVLTAKDTLIFDLMVTSKFSSSPLFAGTDAKTILPPEIAAKYFGHQFKVEDIEGELKVVGYNFQGKQIYSRKNPGELASFDEAIIDIIDEYPMKDRIMKAGASGAGTQGGKGEDTRVSDIEQLKQKYNEAVKNRDTVQAITLKNRIFQMERNQIQ